MAANPSDAVDVYIRDTSIPYGVAEIVERLPAWDELSSDVSEARLNFSDRYVYRTGLVALATWRKTLPKHVSVRIYDARCTDAARRLITNSGFRELVEDNAETPSSYRSNRVPIQPLIRGHSAHQTISDIQRTFEQSVGGIDNPAFKALMSELCENTFAHSDFVSPGYIVAGIQAGAYRDMCEIAIADPGIGIRSSYLEGTNGEAKIRIANGASAIELALDGLTSSKPTPPPGSVRSGRGFGLFIVRRLIEENEGKLTIISGDEAVTLDRRAKSRQKLARPWSGTFVGITIDLNNPLPLDAVYEEGVDALVPPAAGPTADIPAPAEREIELAGYGIQLLTREVGVGIRADIGTGLVSGANVRVLLDGVEDVTPSVADECFGKLAESMGEESYRSRIRLVGGQPLLLRLIEFVVRQRVGGQS